MRKITNTTYMDAYPHPYTHIESWIVAGDMTHCFDMLGNMDNDFATKIVGMMNNTLPRNDCKAKVTYNREDGKIYFDNTPQLLVRGWGHLTGIDGMRLSEDDAAKVQDDFANWFCNILNKKNNE